MRRTMAWCCPQASISHINASQPVARTCGSYFVHSRRFGTRQATGFALILRRTESRSSDMPIRRPACRVARGQRARLAGGRPRAACGPARARRGAARHRGLSAHPARLSGGARGRATSRRRRARPYAPGFLRSYGDHLGLDGRSLVARLRPAVETVAPPRALSHREPLSESRRPTAGVADGLARAHGRPLCRLPPVRGYRRGASDRDRRRRLYRTRSHRAVESGDTTAGDRPPRSSWRWSLCRWPKP